MFRDDASLAANPRLWASIQEAMDQAEWFVLLLSPEAAVSTWVDREVEWWLAHKDPSRIIPVLTGGDFDWDEGVVSNAAPPALHRAFSEEPRWVDLRFAKQEDQLDLSNPAFAGAVADRTCQPAGPRAVGPRHASNGQSAARPVPSPRSAPYRREPIPPCAVPGGRYRYRR